MTDREMMLKRVQICGFALDDAALYLDTHPDDAFALGYYKKHLALHNATTKEYVQKFGPLTRNDFDGVKWDWTEGPWPWQIGEE